MEVSKVSGQTNDTNYDRVYNLVSISETESVSKQAFRI